MSLFFIREIRVWRLDEEGLRCLVVGKGTETFDLVFNWNHVMVCLSDS